MGRRVPTAIEIQVRRQILKGVAFATIADRFDIGFGTVQRIRDRMPDTAEVAEALTYDAVRKALRKGSQTISELAGSLGCTQKAVKQAIKEMRSRGLMVLELHGRYELQHSVTLESGIFTYKSSTPERLFGVVSDNHLCNKHSRLDVLNEAYNYFSELGITDVFNAGNWIDGEARFNKTELLTAPGMDNQLDYMIDKYPQREGITTHYIAGDDHEGWYQQREGVEVGRYLEMRAKEQGRNDLHYLGYGECDVKLQVARGSAVMRVVHPGGGSSYAISYTDQKRVESYQGGEKPQVEIAGHYHKFNYGYPREVHTLQAGCTCDQTMFMRKKRLQAHVGFCAVSLTQGENGAITRFTPEWHPRFDRGYYERRFV